MTPGFFIWVVIYIVVIQLSLTILFYLFFQAKRNALLFSFAFVHLITILWTLRALLVLVVVSYIKDQNQLLAAFDLINWKLGVFVGAFIGLAWLMFSLNYVEWKLSKNKKVILLLAAPSVCFFIVAVTNNYHHLFMKDFSPGIFYWMHVLIKYGYIITGFFVLVKYAIKQNGPELKRTVLLMISYCLPFVSSIINEYRLEILHIKPILGYYDPAPIGFFIGTVFITLIIHKYRFLNIKTIALNKIVDNLKQAIIIVDHFNKVVGMNRSFIDVFLSARQIKHDVNIVFLNKFFENSMDNHQEIHEIVRIINSNSQESFQGELKLVKPDLRYYDLVIYPILGNGKVLGRIISFDDITKIKRVMAELEKKNDDLSGLNNELVSKNEQLRDYAVAVEELAVIKERNRFSRDVHDTLGHTMTVLITQLQVIGIICDQEPNKVKGIIREILNTAKDGLNELRRSISGLRPGKLNGNNLDEAINKLITDFGATGMKIDFLVNGECNNMNSEYYHVIFRICQEALTNSLRHGKAKHVDIVLNYIDGRVKVLIKDDGCGCIKINKGFGLTGMEERVINLGGIIHYGSDGEKGFNIFFELPAMSTLESK